MKHIFQLFCILIVLFVIISCSTSTQSSRTVLLNGTGLSGWTFILADSSVQPEDVWQIKNGVVHCTGVPNGYIRTTESYSNYNLHVEWRWADNPTNSGVLIHCQMPDGVWPNAFECQLMAGNAGDFVIIGEGSVTVGDTTYAITEGYEIISKQNESSEKPAGEWNTYDIIADGASVSATVNGVLQNFGSDLTLTSGFIALQSEGSPIEFRNIWIETLNK